jgi:hypothetical protein
MFDRGEQDFFVFDEMNNVASLTSQLLECTTQSQYRYIYICFWNIQQSVIWLIVFSKHFVQETTLSFFREIRCECKHIRKATDFVIKDKKNKYTK